ncbi:MAG: hypothetical protein CM15mP107_4800 [Bacteroidota bacterium]|nr:MAG: hypothetical protein CM15mP107_4800 [Bacteroidota bacterium]
MGQIGNSNFTANTVNIISPFAISNIQYCNNDATVTEFVMKMNLQDVRILMLLTIMLMQKLTMVHVLLLF